VRREAGSSSSMAMRLRPVPHGPSPITSHSKRVPIAEAGNAMVTSKPGHPSPAVIGGIGRSLHAPEGRPCSSQLPRSRAFAKRRVGRPVR
jgi:hypothetical protein